MPIRFARTASVLGTPLAACVIALAAAGMLWMTWRKWPDPQVDFGKELYIAWQLAQGAVLYRDIAHFAGPLSPYANALWFRLFGADVMTLAYANLAVIGAIAVLWFRELAWIGSRASATLGCVVFVVAFAFAQYTGYGIFNFVAPLGHEPTHGLLLSLAAIAGLGAYLRDARAAYALLSGASLGLLVLTRVEAVVATAAALAVGWLLALRDRDVASRRRAGAMFAVGAVVPALVAVAALSSAMPWRVALGGVFGSWRALHAGDVLRLELFRRAMGIDDPGASLVRIASWAAGSPRTAT